MQPKLVQESVLPLAVSLDMLGLEQELLLGRRQGWPSGLLPDL